MPPHLASPPNGGEDSEEIPTNSGGNSRRIPPPCAPGERRPHCGARQIPPVRGSMEPMLKAAPPQAAPADLIKDSDQTKFAKDVLEASRTVPVIVDFWAPGCGPCKQLQRAIEKVVKAANGAVKLVKINIDQNQMVAQQLRI